MNGLRSSLARALDEDSTLAKRGPGPRSHQRIIYTTRRGAE